VRRLISGRSRVARAASAISSVGWLRGPPKDGFVSV
jgi:hypothetical protein